MFSSLLIPFYFVLIIMGHLNFLGAEEEYHLPLCSVGVGYLDAKHYSGKIVQLEMKWGSKFWHCVRPQATFLFTQQCSTYVGLGIGLELSLCEQVILIPSFSPGIYLKGKGKDLGYPIEFRSAIELAYEMKNKTRIGLQLSHVSNAHLCHKNPGFNSLTLCLSFPLRTQN